MLPAPFCCFCCFCCCCWVLLDGPALSSPAGSGSLYTRVSRMKHLNLNALRRSCTAAAAIAAALVDVCYWRQSAVHCGGSTLLAHTCVGSSSVAQATSSSSACSSGGASCGGQLIRRSLMIRPVPGESQACSGSSSGSSGSSSSSGGGGSGEKEQAGSSGDQRQGMHACADSCRRVMMLSACMRTPWPVSRALQAGSTLPAAGRALGGPRELLRASPC